MKRKEIKAHREEVATAIKKIIFGTPVYDWRIGDTLNNVKIKEI